MKGGENMNYDLIIRNGFVIFPDEVQKVDLVVKDGVIVKIDKNVMGSSDRVIDAEDKYIFPGMIDSHVHFNEPGREIWEGFLTGSNMMAAGGITTFFDMPLNGIPSTIDRSALLQKANIGQKKSLVDFGLWGGLVPGNVNQLKELADAGVVGFKAFLSETGNREFERVDDMTLLEGMKEIASLGKILALHAESGPITNVLTKWKKEQGCLSTDDYIETRPIVAEVEAVERAITYAKLTGCSLHFVHISSEEAILKIEEAKHDGVDVTVETCPHYLLFTHDDLVRKGPVAKCAPPLRKKPEQEKLIQQLLDGKIDMVTSDHSPCPYGMKDPMTHNLFQAWGGISGGQFTLMAMVEMAKKYEIPLTKIAKWTSLHPATRFGLTTKGKIAVGMDADLAIVSIDDSYTVTEDNFFAKHKQSLYLGHTFPCKIKATLLRGEVVYENGHINGQERSGQWLRPGGLPSLRESEIASFDVQLKAF